LTWKVSSIAICTLLLIGISVGTFSIHVVKSTPPSIPPDWEVIPIDQLNRTYIPPRILYHPDWDNITVADLWALPPQPNYYGIFPLSLRNLVVEAMVSGWVGVLVFCLTFYSLSRRFVWDRKKIFAVFIMTIVGGASLTIVSWVHQVEPISLSTHNYSSLVGPGKPAIEFIYYGYPFTWLYASRSILWWGSLEWHYTTQLYGLVGNIAFYMWLIFGSLVGFMIFHKRIWKSPQLQKTS